MTVTRSRPAARELAGVDPPVDPYIQRPPLCVDTRVSGPGIVLPLAAAAVAALMVATWAEGVRRKDISIVDPVWGPAFVLVALVGAVAGGGDPARRWLFWR